MPRIGPVGVAVPPLVPQATLREAASTMAPAGVLRMFDNSRIQQRAIAMPLDWYMEPHGFADRNEAYARVGLDLAHRASEEALEASGLVAADLDAVLFVSTTGIATPSLDARLAASLGCRPDVLRLPLWGWGCAGGVAGLNRAADLVRGRPGSKVLVVCLELCTLSFDPGRLLGGAGQKKAGVAASLFSDGCAAVVVRGDDASGPGLHHVRSASHLFPDTERVMGWDVRDDHLEVVLSPEIPDIVRREMPGLVARIAGGTAIDHWVLHPGGARVVDAYAEALGLSERDLHATRGVLAEHGNMSSPTVLVVLRRVMERMRPGASALLAGLGPGFASEMALVQA